MYYGMPVTVLCVCQLGLYKVLSINQILDWFEYLLQVYCYLLYKKPRDTIVSDSNTCTLEVMLISWYKVSICMIYFIWTRVLKQVMLDLQELPPKTSCHDSVVTGELSVHAQYQQAPCELSDTHDEDFDIEHTCTCLLFTFNRWWQICRSFFQKPVVMSLWSLAK